MHDVLAHQYAAWLAAHRRIIHVVAILVTIGCGLIASQLTVRTDLTKLLPQSTPSVIDLEAIQHRARAFGTVQIVLDSPDRSQLDNVGARVRRSLAALPSDQVVAFSPDDQPLRTFIWEHRFLLAKLDDLVAARDALSERMRRAKLDANPLFIRLEDPEPAGPDRLAELEERITKIERDARAAPRRLSADGRLELFVVQTGFPVSDYDRTRALIRQISDILDESTAGTGVTYGLAGNAVLTLEEHDSVLRGMALSVGLTVLLCGIGLLLYYRSGRGVIAMLLAVAVGVSITFALAYLVVGHLDMMSAFLIAIVVGNGINAGLILVARYFEEIRAGRVADDAMGRAIAGTLFGTLGATATAAIAYGSLIVTDFRGFRHFGEIAAIGMIATWVTTFTVLPAILSSFSRRGWKKLRTPTIGTLLGRLTPARRFGTVVAIGAGLTLAAGAVTTAYVLDEPFTKDWRDLQSTTDKLLVTRAVGAKIGRGFDTETTLSGQAYQAVIAVERRDQLAPLIAKIRQADAARPPPLRWLRDIRSLDDLVPPDQAAKLVVLADIRRLIDDPTLVAALDDRERAELARVRPVDDPKPIVDADVPPALSWPFIEKDGSRGKLAILRGSRTLDSFNVADRLRFAAEIQSLKLPPETLVAGEALVVAEIIETMERDAPRMVLLALLGSIIGVFAVVGWRRHGLVTLVCGFAGVVVMIAACAIVGLRVHFVDLIALPITIGIGIDYCVNLAIRDRQDGALGPKHLVATTGSAVLLCSFTTTVGYATLMLSANGGVRAFGLAALLGELSCITMALLIAPALLALLRRRAGG